jgi:hypothetical protein
MRFLFILLVMATLSGCSKRAVDIDPEWAKVWTSSSNPAYTLTIDFDGKAVFVHKSGETFQGVARYEHPVMKIGTKKFVVTQTPTYFGPPLNRWSIEIDNMQMLRY